MPGFFMRNVGGDKRRLSLYRALRLVIPALNRGSSTSPWISRQGVTELAHF